VTLTASLTTTQAGGREVTTTVYNGSFPGPTLRIDPGDTLRVTLVNQLDAPTNFHTHGFHTTPLGFGDNVLHQLEPGGSWDLEFPTLPDHPEGVYWYHPHPHGISDGQVNGGMAGVIINSGPLDYLPGIKGLTERLLVIQATQFADDGSLVAPAWQQAPDTKVRYVNGQVNPVIRIAPGETQRWRLANVSSDTFVDLVLDDHLLHQIANDANPRDEVQPTDHVVLAPAERAEVLVQASTTPGTYFLRTLAWESDLEVVVATVLVEGEPVAPSALPTLLIPYEDLRTVPVDVRRDIHFQILDGANGPILAINGKPFDMDRVDITARLGDVEEWTLYNDSDFWHPFHIHINDFQVVEIQGQPFDAHGQQDTVPLPPRGWVRIRTRFADFPGRWVYHCHILLHEDAGMMGIIEVVE
jgi:FtsP/CotA-like multicopper oxidase with cupredoxin domain